MNQDRIKQVSNSLSLVRLLTGWVTGLNYLQCSDDDASVK